MSRAIQDVVLERPRADAVVVVLEGEHDRTSQHELSKLLNGLVMETRVVVVDLSQAQFIDSTVISILMEAMKTAAARGHVFRLQMGTADIVERIFEITGVLEYLECAPTRTEALSV
jgi:anti-anti-sigma factor